MKQVLESDQWRPRILVVDDLFGRNVAGTANSDRENVCARFLLRDVTGDPAAQASLQKVLQPIADVVFFRGQTPIDARIGDLVENDPQDVLSLVRRGYLGAQRTGYVADFWSLVLVDLCFYTGRVTGESHGHTPGMPDGRLLDSTPNGYFGLELIESMSREFPDLPVMVLSSKSREDVSLEFSNRGAVGFIARDDLRGPEKLAEALHLHGLLPDATGEIVGQSLSLLLALREARRASLHRENVLIRGERGTGKELVARYLHRNSCPPGKESTSPFVTVNSAVFTPSLFPSEFFGIEPRTATGVDGKTGLIEAAEGGDLFLDEVGDMPDEAQAAILRVLQERQYTRVGSKQPRHADVRFVSATNAAIEGTEREFRADVLDRLRLGGTITLPPLRERKEDLQFLAEYFVGEAERQNRAARHRRLSRETIGRLQSHDWPGNIRELRSVLFDAVNRFPDVEHLVPGHLRLGKSSPKTRLAEFRTAPDSEPQKVKDERSSSRAESLDTLLNAMEGFEFQSQTVGEWAGRWGDLHKACSLLLSRQLDACLNATRRRSPQDPEGQIQIHPAVKLLTGDSSLTASQAADLIKRLLGPMEHNLHGSLREAYQVAIRLRPKSSRLLRHRRSRTS